MDTIEALGLARRCIADDLRLMQEALHAARKGKMHVVIDHLERVIESHQRTLEKTSQ